MTERIISADSHVAVSHDQVKAHLAERYHQAYDDAVTSFYTRLAASAGTMKPADKNSAFGEPGYWNPVERLKAMDTDGVEAEVLYSEVSAFRFLGDMKEGTDEAVRAFNDVLHDFAEPDPKRLVVSYQVPIHDVDLAVREVERVLGRQREVAPAAGLSERVRPARVLRRALRRAVRAHRGGRPPGVPAHRAQHQPRQPDASGPDRAPQFAGIPAEERGLMVYANAARLWNL